jgi:hypothetical protein
MSSRVSLPVTLAIKSIRRDIEWGTEPQVCRPLIHEAREARLSVRLGIRGQVVVKLAEEMTRR